MSLYDQHLHSWHSFDSEAGPAAQCQAAVEKGLAGITFTEHYDTHPEDWPTCRYDDGKISETIGAVREWFRGKLVVGKGIEVCYQPQRMPAILDFLESHRFDLVILSVHWAGGRALGRPDGWAGQWQQRTREYLQTVLEAARFCAARRELGERPFDVLGHLDVVKRYTRRYCGEYDLRFCGDVIDEILRTCVAVELAVEINTSTLRQGLDEVMPAEWVLERYATFDGRRITLGSDAHTSRSVGAAFSETARMLKDKGLTHYCVFRNRQAHFEPL